MSTKKIPQLAEFYRQRFGYKQEILSEVPKVGTQLIVTIPCYNEPDLLTTLKSLCECLPTKCKVEVIVGINCGANASDAVRNQNQQTLQAFEKWRDVEGHQFGHLNFHALYVDDLPAKHAGAGMARKVVMDEALYRFASLEIDGGIVCLDADCTVAPNYLQALEQAFVHDKTTKSAALYFEHPYQKEEDEQLSEGIVNYELYLRYYIQGLRYAQFPYQLHTVGSSMAVRASTYAQTGGMNRRKAGEDFYFMHKMMPQGNGVEVNETCVFPSCRLSDRVPFGTGRAQHEWVKNKENTFYTYDPQVFADLKLFLNEIEQMYKDDHLSQHKLNWPKTISSFLKQQNFEDEWNKLKRTTTTYKTFHRRFFLWFDGFKVLKFIHFARDHYYKNVPLQFGAEKLLHNLSSSFSENYNIEELLQIYRKLDRLGIES